jgi:23S rRNA (guanosine2251-2'-O)-methyltransferase
VQEPFFDTFEINKKKFMRKLGIEEMDRLTVEEFKESEKFPFVIVLDNIRSLNNVGSFFRTADALQG